MNDPKNAVAPPVSEQGQPPRPEQQPTPPTPAVPSPHPGQEDKDKDRKETPHRREGVVSNPD